MDLMIGNEEEGTRFEGDCDIADFLGYNSKKMLGSAFECVGLTSSEKGWPFLTGLFTSWAIYLCTGLSSLELEKQRSCVELVLSFVITSSEILAPWSLLFHYYGANNLLFVTTILDLVPYMVWMRHFIFKSAHALEIKCYCIVALVFELKVSAFLSLMFGERGVLYIRTCGGCFASLAPSLYLLCEDWHPSRIHMLSQFLRIIASSSELLLDNDWHDMFLKWEPVKICRMLTIVSAFLNLCVALVRIFDLWDRFFKKVRSQKLSPLGTNYTSDELYRRLAMTFASVPMGTEALV